MKKFSLTHKLLAVALAFVLVAVSLPDYLSFAQQPAQEQSETDELADGDPSDTGEQEMEQQVVLHLQAPETVPMGTAGSFGLSAQNTAAVAADVSIQLTQEEMAAYQVAEQDSTLALQPVGDSLTFTLQPGEQVEGTLSFLYPNGYSSREVVEIAEEDISIVLQQLPEEETGGAPIETIPPEGEIQPPEQGQTPPADETQQPGGEGPTDPLDEEEPTPPESGDGEEPTDPSDGGETTPPESGDGEEATDPSDGEDETLPPESGDGEEATDSSNEEETTPPDDETDPSVGEGGVMPSDEQEQVLQTVEQSTVSLTQDYQTGPDGELSEEPTTDSEPADESGTTENEGSTEPSGSESGNPTDPENTGGDNSSSSTEDDDQQGNDPTGSQGDGQQGDDPTGSQGDGQQSDDPTGSQGDGQQDGGPTGSQGDGQQDGDLTGSQDNVQQGNDLTGSQDESGQEQPQVSFDIVGATLTFTASFGWGELTLTAQPLETEQQEAAAQETVPQPDLSYTIEAASQNRETTGTIYTRSWSLQQVIALPQGASFVEGEAVVDGNQIRIGATPVLSVDDQSGTAGELSAQRDGETLLVTYTKTLSDWQSLEAESISDLGLAMMLHQEAIVRDESFTEGQVDVGATFTATPVTAAAEIAPAAVLAVLDTGDEQQDGSQSVTQQGSLSLPLSGEQQPEQPTGGDADEVTVTYEGEAVYTEQGALAVRYTIEVTNGNEPQEPSGGDEGEEQPEGSDGAVKVKIVQNLKDEWFSSTGPTVGEGADGSWSDTEKTLTWENVEIAAGDTWTRTVTVLIDNTKISSIDNLSKNLSSTVLVYKAGEESSEETPPLDRATVEVNLKNRVESEGIEVKEEGNQTQTVYWRDNNASGNRPDPKVYASKVGLEFCIAGDSGAENWVKLTEDNMAQLGLTEMPDILCPEDNTQSQWTLSAELPTEIGYKGTSITQQVKWRMVPPAENADIPAGPEEGGSRPNLSEVYYLDQPEDGNWYYLYRDEVSFNIDLRDAVYADQIEAGKLEDLIKENFQLSYEAGSQKGDFAWEDVDVTITPKGDGQYTLTLVNAVAYSRNGEGVHYYLKPKNLGEQETQISLDRNWPGNGEGGDYYDVECDNTGLDNVGNITDKVANGGTLVLTRQGEIEYQATKIWIDPDGNTDGRPEGHFELWRYTYSEDGGSFKEATTVTGVENVSFKDIGEEREITFTNPNPTNPQNENLFPKYDKDGNRYVYIMKEVIDKEGELSYEQVFGEIGPETGAVQDTRPPVEDESWERDKQDNFVYNDGVITNRISQKETVSVTKKWDASSFQASLKDVEVKVGLYGKPVGSDQNWEPVKGQDGEDLVYTMSEFSAANNTMSQTVTVNSYNSEGQEMEYRFFEISVNGVPILKEEDLAAGAHLQDKEFTIKLDNGQELSFVSKRVDDEEIEETGEQVIENVIQDEITFTINKEWIAPTEPHPVRFAIYQQGPNAENKLVGIVTLDDEIDGENQYSSWEKPAGSEEGKNPTLTVGEGEKPYEVTYQVKNEFAQLVIEGLPRYDEHGYTYEYIALELDGSPEQTTQIDADGNYITDVVNGPGRGYRIMLRKRWIDNSDIEHREPVMLQVYYQVDEISDLENDFLLATVTLGEEGEPWYELVGFSEVDLKEKLGEDFSTGNDFYKHLYIREISIGNSGADDRTTQEEIFIGEDGAVENKCVDQIEATNHTYEATYETQLDGLTVEEGEDTPGISDPLFIVTNRRLGNVDLTVTKEWQDGSQLQELLKGSNVVPVVKLVFDEEKNNAEPPGNVNNPIDYKKGTVQIGNEEVQIKGKDGTSPEEAIQPLLENGELIRELYFYNLPKYDNQGRVARYKVVELWTTKGNIESGKVDNVDECYDLKNFLEKNRDTLSDDLKSLLNDLSVSYQEDSYKENDGQKESDKQQITITNKLTGTKEIKFYKEWNDQYALEHGKRPDLYLTLYRTTKGSGKMQLYADHSWDKQALTISEDGGENAAQAEKETDENYWICTFPDLPKYDANGDEYIYYAVERLTVNDPSDFDYAPAQFEHDGAQADLTVEYDEDGKVVKLPSDEMDADGHKILMLIGDDVALLEGGTFVNTLEETVTITGRKLWNSVPLTADSADLPTVTFEVYQYLESEVPEDSEPAGNDKLVRSMTIESNQWDDLKTDDNQYVFTFDGMEGEDGKPVPFPLYNDKGERYVYILHEVTDKVSDTDWDLVYQDPVYNEYQITNTYDPQLGALSVKKLLELPLNQAGEPLAYPAVTFELYQALPDENENYDFETATKLEDKTQVWTSGAVEEAAEGGTNLSGGGRLVEKVITFEDLPQYAPNGKEYKYFVVELIEGRMYYESAVVMKDVVLPVDGNRGSVEETFNSIFTKGNISNGKDLPTEVIPLTPNTETEDGSSETATPVPVRATFGDRYTTGDEITLQLTKIWEDQNNALGLRPSTEDFADSLKLYRSAPAQGGDGGAEGIDSEDITSSVEINVIVDDENSSHYIVTIKGTDEKPLEQYAPNGMPWVYKVTEDSTGKSWDVYITTPNKQVQKSADQASEDGKLDLGTLTNTLETIHTFTKNWANAGDSNLTWENIGVKEMDVTGTLYVGVMENGTLTGTMTNASDFFEGSQWEAWFKDLGGLGDEEGSYKFEKSQTIDVGSNTTTANSIIKFENLPLVQKSADGTTSQLVYVVAETKVEFEVGGKNYSQEFGPEFKVDGENLTITYAAGNLTQGEEDAGQSFFKPSTVTLSLSDLYNKTSSSSSATNTIATTGLTITKNWVDNNDAEKLRPKSVDLVILKDAKDEQEEVARADLFASREIRTTLDNVVLKANGEPYTVNISGDGSVTVSDLPSVGFDEKGNLITYQYTVRELRPEWQDDDILNVDDLLEANEKYDGHYTVSYDDSTHTVTNTLTHMDITAVKAWKPGTMTGENAEVTFTLQSRVGDGEWTNVDEKQTIELDGTPDQAGEFETWKARWTELPRTDSNGSTIEYRVKETLASDLIENEHVTILYPEKGITGSTADKTYTVTNIPLGQITVTKKGEDGGLPNVEFTLTGSNGKSYEQTTSADGTAIFTGLPLYDSNGTEITYTLKETSTPDGYIQLTEPIEVSFTAETKPEGVVYWATDSGYLLHEVEYEVVNGQYFPVVHTGGSGFYWPGVLGAGAAAAGVLYLIRRKTKGHNTER